MIDLVCRFCQKEFTRESTLAAHLCVKKKRWNDRLTVGARLGLVVFQRFYALTTRSSKPKSDEDFINSKYYADFVKFGRHLVALDPINIDTYIDYVIKNGVKLNDWTKDYVYDSYLESLMKTESVDSAVSRTILEMQDWCEKNEIELQHYFKKIPSVEATFKIRSGKISPWVLYLADSADHLFSRLSEEQGKIIESAIDSRKWQVKFLTNKDDVEFVQNLLREAGL